LCVNERVLQLNIETIVNKLEDEYVAYSVLSNEMVVLHPITKAILDLLIRPMNISQLTEKLETTFENENELDVFVYNAVQELLIRGFVSEG